MKFARNEDRSHSILCTSRGVRSGVRNADSSCAVKIKRDEMRGARGSSIVLPRVSKCVLSVVTRPFPSLPFPFPSLFPPASLPSRLLNQSPGCVVYPGRLFRPHFARFSLAFESDWDGQGGDFQARLSDLRGAHQLRPLRHRLVQVGRRSF